MSIEAFLRREIELGSFPGAAWAVGTPDGIESEGALGHAVAVPLRIPATLDTIWDCASITKPLVTARRVLQIGLRDAFGYSVHQLLTHTSGLRAWMPLYAYDDPLKAILEQGPECERGTRVIYSDLNFVLLWMALREHFADVVPPPPSLRPRIAATEWGQRYEMKMCAERKIAFNGAREGLIWGETHDGNAHYLGGGFAGNAGLFADVRTVFRLTQEFLRADFADEATRNHTPGMEDGRGLGWQIGTGGPATSMLSPGSWGHTGFTGTSVWVDRQRQKIMVLLTNRVHPCAAPIAMQRIRGEFHRLALS